jgi:hypothetical protein
MKIFLLIVFMLAAYTGAFLWRKKISAEQNAFKTKMDLAGDKNHAQHLLQESLEKTGRPR